MEFTKPEWITLIISLFIGLPIKAVYTLHKDRQHNSRESFAQILKIFYENNGDLEIWLK